MRNILKSLTFVAFAGAVLIALSGTSFAGPGKPSLNVAPATDGLSVDADGALDCASEAGCEVPSPNGTGTDPAISFLVTTAGDIALTVDIYSDLDCTTFDSELAGTLNFPSEGLWAVFLDFTPPPPPGTMLSIKWTVDGCDPICFNYTIGSGAMCF